MPTKSGARHRPMSLTCAMMFRQRYDYVGLPCRKTLGSPSPTSTYLISVSRTATRFLGCGSEAVMFDSCQKVLAIFKASARPRRRHRGRDLVNYLDDIR